MVNLRWFFFITDDLCRRQIRTAYHTLKLSSVLLLLHLTRLSSPPVTWILLKWKAVFIPHSLLQHLHLLNQAKLLLQKVFIILIDLLHTLFCRLTHSLLNNFCVFFCTSWLRSRITSWLCWYILICEIIFGFEHIKLVCDIAYKLI